MHEWTRTQVATAALVAFIVVLLGSRALAADRHAVEGTALAAPRTGSPPAGGGSGGGSRFAGGSDGGGVSVSSGAIVVNVAGWVRRPGVYTFAAGSRAIDGLRRAGGARPGADLDQINLAAKLTDGQQLLVPRKPAGEAAVGAAAPTGASASPGAGSAATGGAPAAPVVNLNTATADQLDTLDGVGPATAAKILAYRTAHGGFRSVDELAQVSGIGPKKLAAIKPHVHV